MQQPTLKIPGGLLNASEAYRYKEALGSLLGSRNPDRFPGAQPISFSAQHLETLQKSDFFVTEKTDGIRVLMFTTVDSRDTSRIQTFLIDRKNNYYQQPGMWLPFYHQGRKELLPQIGTLLDGELVLDISNGQEKLRFYAFDCVIYNSKVLLDRPFHKRYGHLDQLVMEPYYKKISMDPTFTKEHRFKLCRKLMETSYNVDRLFHKMQTLHHKSDGIIFTAKDSIYELGTCNSMLKWKPSDENSVDFRVKILNPSDEKPVYELYLGFRGSEEHFYGNFEPDPDLLKEWKKQPPSGRIIECNYDPEWPGHWKFMRHRDDKREPNHLSTFRRVMDSIKDNVSKEEECL